MVDHDDHFNVEDPDDDGEFHEVGHIEINTSPESLLWVCFCGLLPG